MPLPRYQWPEALGFASSDGFAPACFTWIAEGHRIIVGHGASIGSYARIGDGTHIGSYARLGSDAHIGDDARIGSRTHIGSDARIGSRPPIGSDARLGAGAHIGDDARIGAGASEAIDLGFADGFRKCIANVNGVAYIGAGCRWFALAEAIKHWESHDENRDLTLCLMQSAIHIAGLKGWAFSEADQ